MTDPKHCGRCDHDCVGGACSNGKCEPVELAAAQAGTSGLAIDAANVYFTNYGDNAVLKVSKAAGLVTKVVDQDSASGIAIDGTTLYFGGYTSTGGLTKCTVTDCANTKKQLSTAGYLVHIVVSKGVVYFTGNDDEVKRINADGTDERLLTNAYNPFGIAVDDTHVYYSSLAVNLLRVGLDGGTPEPIGPKDAPYNDTFVALDKDRFYWAFYDNNEVGSVLAGLKASPSTRMTFTAAGKASVAVMVDDKYLYWLDAGGYTNNQPNNTGKVYACLKTGCVGAPIELAKDLHLGGPMVQDDKAIYWAEYGGAFNANGRVRKVAKP